MKRISKKLQFTAHTVRALVADDLGQVAGASVKCAPTAGPVRCTQYWSGCANNSENGSCYQIPSLPGGGYEPIPGGGGYSGMYC